MTTSFHVLQPLIGAAEMRAHVNRVAGEIDEVFSDTPFVMLVLMDGGELFSGLLRESLQNTPHVERVKLSSYVGTSSTGNVSCVGDWVKLDPEVPVLVVDDVLDTGHTLAYVKRCLDEQGVKRVKVAVAVRKEASRVHECEPDFCCVDLPDVFLVGFGMDYNGLYRDLPSIHYVEFPA